MRNPPIEIINQSRSASRGETRKRFVVFQSREIYHYFRFGRDREKQRGGGRDREKLRGSFGKEQFAEESIYKIREEQPKTNNTARM